MVLFSTDEDLVQFDSSNNYELLYVKYFIAINNLSLLLPSITSVFFVGMVLLIVLTIIYILNFITELRKDHSQVGSEKDISIAQILVNHKIIVDSKKALEELHQASDKCYIRRYSLRCNELVIYFPDLINISLPTSNGITPFHRVCYRGHYYLIDFMLAKGATPWKETNSGENALHMAIDYYIRHSTQRKFDCLDLLYERGCFLKKNNDSYIKLVSEAEIAGNKDLVQWLISHTIPPCERVVEENEDKSIQTLK